MSVLQKGEDKAVCIANQTLKKVQEAVGMR